MGTYNLNLVKQAELSSRYESVLQPRCDDIEVRVPNHNSVPVISECARKQKSNGS